MSHAMMSYDKLYLTNKEVAICKRWLEKVYSKHPIGTSKNLHKRKNTHGKYSIDWIKQPHLSEGDFTNRETMEKHNPFPTFLSKPLNTLHTPTAARDCVKARMRYAWDSSRSILQTCINDISAFSYGISTLPVMIRNRAITSCRVTESRCLKRVSLKSERIFARWTNCKLKLSLFEGKLQTVMRLKKTTTKGTLDIQEWRRYYLNNNNQ